jgi:hypothetical protein
MENDVTGFEESARIVEVFAEGEDDPRFLDLLADLAQAIRQRALND